MVFALLGNYLLEFPDARKEAKRYLRQFLLFVFSMQLRRAKSIVLVGGNMCPSSIAPQVLPALVF